MGDQQTIASFIEAIMASDEFIEKAESPLSNWLTNFERYQAATESDADTDTYITAPELGDNPGNPETNAGIRGIYGVQVQLIDQVGSASLAPSNAF